MSSIINTTNARKAKEVNAANVAATTT